MERRLSEEERDELLSQPLEAVIATERRTGGVHAVPVWFLYRAGALRVITGSESVKLRNAMRSGRATICVPWARGDDIRYVAVEGPVRVEPCTGAERHDLWAHYRNEEVALAMGSGDLTGMRVLVVTPERWTAIAE